jgi:polar amino acid transport system permease protein
LRCPSSSFFAEIYRAGIQSMERSQWEGGKAIGMTQVALMRRIILPQAIRRMVPAFLERSFELMKGTTNVSAIAYGDLLYRALELSARLYRPIEILTLVAIVFFVMLTLTSILIRIMENRLDAARL